MPTITSHVIEPLRDAVLTRLRATVDFQVPPELSIVSTSDQDPAKQVQEALGAAGGAGAVVLVAQPRLSPRGAHVQSLAIPIDIEERVALNRGVGGNRRTAQAIAELVVERLRQWQPALAVGPLDLASWDRPDGTGAQVHSLTFNASLMLA